MLGALDMNDVTGQNDITGDQNETATATIDDEEDDNEVETDEQGRRKVTLKSGNTEVFFFTSVPANLEEAASDKFFGSQAALQKVVEKAWENRKKSSVYPGLAAAIKAGMDVNKYAQTTADAYKPGRRGGFAVTVDADQLRKTMSEAPSVEAAIAAMMAQLKLAGVQFAGEAGSDAPAAS